MIRLRLLKILGPSSGRPIYNLALQQGPLRLGLPSPLDFTFFLVVRSRCPPLVQRKEVNQVLTMRPPERATPNVAR